MSLGPKLHFLGILNFFMDETEVGFGAGDPNDPEAKRGGH